MSSPILKRTIITCASSVTDRDTSSGERSSVTLVVARVVVHAVETWFPQHIETSDGFVDVKIVKVDLETRAW